MTPPPRFAAPPPGRLRVSGAVLDHVVTVAAGAVPGVLSTESLAGAAALGGTVGGVLGLVQGGPVGAALGASVGGAAGAATARALSGRLRARALLDVGADAGGGAAPALRVAVVARYGRDLAALAAEVRAEVEAALRETVGLVPGPVVVEVVDVVDPASPLL